MTLRSRLRQKKAGVLQRWLAGSTAIYAPDTSSFLHREEDPFANPVGHALRTGTEGILDCIADEFDPDRVCEHLQSIVKIRAIQDLSPSQAISFIFLLKESMRAELKPDLASVASLDELAEIESSVDQVALFAFDIYTKCRDQVSELRINEIKRSVAGLMHRFHDDAPDTGTPPVARVNGDTQGGNIQ